jgi:hypothetical protein
MSHRKVVPLEILYRTMYRKIVLYLGKIMKTRLKAAGVQKMVVEHRLFNLKCYDKLLG